MKSRRRFIKLGAAAGVGAYAAAKFGGWRTAFMQVPGGTLPPDAIPKFVKPLIVPAAMPRVGRTTTTDYYSIAVRQFRQQVLPSSLPDTAVWGYGSTSDPRSFQYPAYSIEATAGRQVRVTWINDLVDKDGKYLRHLLPVDQTLHWANPPGGVQRRDSASLDAKPYSGPVPLVTHVHGAHVSDESDGYPEAWFLPAATNIPAGFAAVGSWHEHFRRKYGTAWGGDWERGSATFVYPNDQRATTLWYHDHTLGMTRVNVYAGPAGFYLLRGGAGDLAPSALPGPAPREGDAAGTPCYEIPIVIQDRSFNSDGSLFYPDNRAFFEALSLGQLQVPFIPDQGCTGQSDISPIWNPEFFGNTMVVNGQTWPYLDVEQRRYRFRLLNGCDSRFLMLTLSRAGMPFWQIGADGGFLPAPVALERLLIAPAERADVIVDFTNVPVGTELLLLNVAPDEPFGGGEPGIDFDPADSATTGQVLQFRVKAARARDVSTPAASLTLPRDTRLGRASVTRRVSLNELESATVSVDMHAGHGHKAHQPGQIKMMCGSGIAFGPTQAMLGTLTAAGEGNPLHWMHEVTENPAPGSTEIWEIHNFTEDAHPIHVHLVQFEVLERQAADGTVRGPEAWESGRKDTLVAYPGEITRIKAVFDRAGQYVWHCHILSHEDNEMMRPYAVGTPQKPAL